MRRTILTSALAFSVAAQASTKFTYFAAPNLTYQCSGYTKSSCSGFQTSNATYTVNSVGIKVTQAKPLRFQVSMYLNGDHYQGVVDAANTGFPFLLYETTGSGVTFSVTMIYVAQRHCTAAGACATRYLPESGTIELP